MVRRARADWHEGQRRRRSEPGGDGPVAPTVIRQAHFRFLFYGDTVHGHPFAGRADATFRWINEDGSVGGTAGGALDLTWLAGVALMALAAHAGRPATVAAAGYSARVGWRVIALPLACNIASLLVLGAGYGDRLNPAAAWLAVG